MFRLIFLPLLLALPTSAQQPSHSATDSPPETSDANQSTETRPPNILLILANDQPALAASPWLEELESPLREANQHAPITPELDRFCAESTRFASAWVTGLDQAAVRPAWLTGHHPGSPLDLPGWTLPAELRAHGYRTALFGDRPGTAPAAAEGWDDYALTDPRSPQLNPLYLTPTTRRLASGNEAELTGARAREWIAAQHQQSPEQPFFALCQFHAPGPNPLPLPQHAELWGPELLRQVPEGWAFHPALATFPDAPEATPPAAPGLRFGADLAAIAQRGDDLWFTGSSPRLPQLLQRLEPAQRPDWLESYQRRNELLRQARFDSQLAADARWQKRWQLERYLRLYLGALRSADAQLGQMLDFLESQGLSETTLVIYASDQGSLVGQLGLSGQDWSRAASFRIPLALRWPGKIAAGAVLEAPIQSIDLPPTLLELAGIRRANWRGTERIQGRDFSSLLLQRRHSLPPARQLYFADQPDNPPFAATLVNGVLQSRRNDTKETALDPAPPEPAAAQPAEPAP